MKRILYALLVTLWVVTGCSNDSDSVIGNNGKLVEVDKQEPDMPLEMPSDFNFMVSFGYGGVSKNVIDSYKGTVTKDLISNGSATTNIVFTRVELREIYDKMRAIDIMKPKEMPKEGGCNQIPSGEDRWEITINGNTKTFSWTDRYCELTEDANQLLELRNFIQHMIESKDAYKALPEAVGGYE